MSRVENMTVAASAKATPASRKLVGRAPSPTSKSPAATISTAPRASAHSNGSSSRRMASVAPKSGALPTTTAVREAPASRTASTKKICETPGARSPASAKTASSRGRASSPVPGSSAAATPATSTATTVLATAPTSGSGCPRSATRSATVIAPNRNADPSASRMAAIGGPPYPGRHAGPGTGTRLAGEAGEAEWSTPEGGGSQLPRRGDAATRARQTPRRRGNPGAPMRRGHSGQRFPPKGKRGHAAAPFLVNGPVRPGIYSPTT